MKPAKQVSFQNEPAANLAATCNESMTNDTDNSHDPYQFTCFSINTPSYGTADKYAWTCPHHGNHNFIHHSNSECSIHEHINTSEDENATFEDAFTWMHNIVQHDDSQSTEDVINQESKVEWNSDNHIPLPNPFCKWSSSTQKMKIPSQLKGKHSIFTYDINHDANHLSLTKSKHGRTRLCCSMPTSGLALALPTGAKTSDRNSLIWDSGASHSVTSNSNLLQRTTAAPFNTIKGLSGRSSVTAIGALNTVEEVLAVPGTTQDLLSVGAFLDQKGGQLIFTANQVLYKSDHPFTKPPTLIGRRREDGLYSALNTALNLPSPSINLSRPEMQFQRIRERVHTLHRMLGHVGKSKMKTIVSRYPRMGLKPHHIDLLTYCEACKVGNAKFSSKPRKSHNQSRTFGERLLSDNSGIVRIQSRGGCKYACVVVDEYSSWVWLRGLHSLKQTKDFIKHVIEVKLHQRDDRFVRYFRSDNGTEYINREMDLLLSQHGIERERTCAGSSFQNGKAERHIGILFSMMRKALYESRMPASFWIEALHWAVYTHNRLPLSSRKDGKSPFQLRFGRLPNIGLLRPFGVRGSITLMKTSRNGKQEATGEPCILVGYGYVTGKKGYRVFRPQTNSVTTSIHCSFDTMYQSILQRRSEHPHLYVDDRDRVVQCSMLDKSVPSCDQHNAPSALFRNSAIVSEAAAVGGIASDSTTISNHSGNIETTLRNSTLESHNQNQNRISNRVTTATIAPTTPPRSQISDIQRMVDVDEKTPAFRLTEHEANQDELPERIINRLSSIEENQKQVHAKSTTIHNGNAKSTTYENIPLYQVEAHSNASRPSTKSVTKEPSPVLSSPAKKQKNCKGYEYISADHPYLNRDKDGRPIATSDHVDGDSIAERMKNRRSQDNAKGFALVSDCHPNYMGAVAYVTNKTKDLASNHKTPKHYGEILQSPEKQQWLDAVQLELNSLNEMNCYVEVKEADLPPNVNVLNCIWVFKIKKNGDGTIERYKARICVRGDQQKYGIDYVDVFSPVAVNTSIRLVLALAVHCELELLQYDIKLAFVSSKVDRPVYIKIPPGAKRTPGKVWQLKKSLYGLKQAPRLFNEHLHNILQLQGFQRSSKDACLYFYRTAQIFTVLVIVVDDILLATNNKTHAKQFESTMQTYFDLKAMGCPKYMIGMNLTRGPDFITISQQEYIRDIAQRFNIETDTPTKLPASSSVKLSSEGFAGQPDSPKINAKEYRSIVGALMYAVVTRPDVATAVSMAARFMHTPTQNHMKFARKILRYLFDTKDKKLTYSKTENPDIVVYADSSHGDDPETRRSRYGYLIYFGNALVSWKSKLGSVVTLSTAEAEYVCATHACKEIMWMKHLLKELGKCQKYPVIINEDNQACIAMSKNPVVSGRNKHMEIKMHYVRQCVEQNEVTLRYIGTRDQLADIMTKNLPSPMFLPMREKIFNPGMHKPVGMC